MVNPLFSAKLLTAVLSATVFIGLMTHNIVQSNATTSNSAWDLSTQYAIGKPLAINEINNNLSGLTYHPETDHLFAITNNPEQIFELGKQGQVIRTISLHGFEDTESIEYLGDNRFVVSEERRNQLAIFNLNTDTQDIYHQDSQLISLGDYDKTNRGVEGVAWSAQHGFFVAREEPPALLLQTTNNLHSSSNINVDSLNHEVASDLDDFAGLSLLKQNNEDLLLILSEKSHRLSLIDMQGETLSSLPLRHGFLNVWPLMKQPEGVAVDNDGNIYIVGEPNQFLTLTRQRL